MTNNNQKINNNSNKNLNKTCKNKLAVAKSNRRNSKNKLFACNFSFKDNRATLTLLVSATDFVSANVIAIKRFIAEYCDNNENILLAHTNIKKCSCYALKSKNYKKMQKESNYVYTNK